MFILCPKRSKHEKLALGCSNTIEGFVGSTWREQMVRMFQMHPTESQEASHLIDTISWGDLLPTWCPFSPRQLLSSHFARFPCLLSPIVSTGTWSRLVPLTAGGAQCYPDLPEMLGLGFPLHWSEAGQAARCPQLRGGAGQRKPVSSACSQTWSVSSFRARYGHGITAVPSCLWKNLCKITTGRR